MKNLTLFSLGMLCFVACNRNSKETEENVVDTDTDTNTDTDTDTEDTDTEDTDTANQTENPIEETVGPDGGSFEANSGGESASIEIPAGALTEDVDIVVEPTEVEDLSAAIEDFADISGTAWVFTPHGTTFEQEIMITLSQNGSADTMLRLDDENDTTLEMVSGANFTPNNVSFMTNTFSIYLPVSTCETYCGNVEQLCSGSGLSHAMCMDTCRVYNLTNPPATCAPAIQNNYVCLTEASLGSSDFDCSTGVPWPWTCMESQYQAQNCVSGGGCDDLTGTWYTRMYSEGQVITVENAAGDLVDLIVKSTVSVVQHVDLPQSLSPEFPVSDFTTIYKHSYETVDVYGTPLDDPYPAIYVAADTSGTYRVAFESDSVHVSQVFENVCDPFYRKIEGIFQMDELVSILFKKYVAASDQDGDGWTTDGGDCDDSDATIYPQATEIENDGIDSNCNGVDG